MQVEPQTPLPAVYQITDHTDANRDSYYVRAVMRDSLSGSTLQSLNLASAGAGTGRYSGSMPAPADGTGLGRQIDITITVYTDSGYSTKSELYQQIVEKWYVKSGPVHYGGGGGDVDYDHLKKMFESILTKKLDNLPPPEPVDLSGLTEDIRDLSEMFSNLDIPKPERVNLQPILERIGSGVSSLKELIGNIPPPETIDYKRMGDELERRVLDFSPLVKAIEGFKQALTDSMESLTASQKAEIVGAVDKAVREVLKENVERNDKINSALRTLFADGEVAPMVPSEKEKKPSTFSRFIT